MNTAALSLRPVAPTGSLQAAAAGSFVAGIGGKGWVEEKAARRCHSSGKNLLKGGMQNDFNATRVSLRYCTVTGVLYVVGFVPLQIYKHSTDSCAFVRDARKSLLILLSTGLDRTELLCTNNTA